MTNKLLRQLPSVDRLILSEEAKDLIEKYNRKQVVNAARIVLKDLRTEILNRQEEPITDIDISLELVFERMKNLLENKFSLSLKEAVNAAGVLLHTGLGRAVLPETALKNIQEVSKGYSTLAIDLETGRRGHRDTHLNGLLCELTGAQSSVVVNNNAAATVLILNSLAKGKEVILSRGQLVEIGGSFRMPDILAAS
ncbi:MAG: hypothetical protein V3R45_06025, partial [Candidatus Aminicenantaceae bacterium]